MTPFNEAALESAILSLLESQGYPHQLGNTIVRESAAYVLIKDDLRRYLRRRYAKDSITEAEIEAVIRRLEAQNAADLYDSNRTICKLVSNGFFLKREDRSKQDLYIQLIDYSGLPDQHIPKPGLETVVSDGAGTYHVDPNIYKVVNQLKIEGKEETRVPDAILYINGLPLVVFEFKSTTKEKATLHDAHKQITIRYKRDIPELMKYNALCILSDGVNTKMGSLFAAYEFYYTWRKVTGDEDIAQDGINALHTMIQGLFDKDRLRYVIRHFIFFPDSSKSELKIVCRYPQFYAATKLYDNIKRHKRPHGDGKGGTYFGATGCGKSYTMLFLTRLLMKSVAFGSPTIILITDRTDLDDQLSEQFGGAKGYINDQEVVSVTSRSHLRDELKGRKSGGVFLTTIHKFTEDTQLLTTSHNVICISDEAHRSQVNLDQKLRVTKDGVKRTYGFAKYLHDSLPNATYVGFTGTPIDDTLKVFGPVVDAYTMTESVKDEITVRIVYEGRAAKVLLDSKELEKVEDYYAQCADEGSSDYQIETSKRANTQMHAILGDPGRIQSLAEDFIAHYETRVSEGSTVKGKAMFVSSKREIAYAFWQALIERRPEWNEVLACEEGAALSEQEKKEIKPMERVKMIMTRNKDDPPKLYALLGTKDYRKELDRQFKNDKSNFKVAIVVDMWLTGFDVPFLDSIYIDKPIRRHTLIQTISRVNRRFPEKEKGLVIDYIGIKKQMTLAMAHYNKSDQENVEDVGQSVIVVKNYLDLLNKLFFGFDDSPFFEGSPIEQLNCLNMAAEYAQRSAKFERRFMGMVRRLKAAYDICCGTDSLSQEERDRIHFYMAVRTILYKLTKGDAPDTAQMNARVRELIKRALQSEGVEELFKIDDNTAGTLDLFNEDYLAKLDKIKLPNTKLKILQQLLARAIEDFKKVNRAKGIDFSKKFQALVAKYNERDESSIFVASVLEDFSNEVVDLIQALGREQSSHADIGVSFEEKAFYDILKSLTRKYDFTYPEDKLLVLAKEVKELVDDLVQYTDWSQRTDIKAELRAELILLLDKHGYPPVERSEVYKEIFEQASNYKKNRGA